MTRYVIRNRLRELMAAKERKEGRKITQMGLSEELGIARWTVDRWARNEVARMDEHIVIAFCRYFDCQPGDLIVMETIDAPEDTELGQRKTPLSIQA